MITQEDLDLYSNRAQNLLNYNEALTTNFEIVFNKFPGTAYFAQSVTIPGVNVSGIRTAFKQGRTFMPDNQIDFGELSIQFIVDEDFENYDALLREFYVHDTARKGNGNNIREVLHDMSVIRMSSNKVPIAVFKFTDVSLTSLGSITYTTTSSESDIIICDANFSVTKMYVKSFRKSNLLDGTFKCDKESGKC